MNKLKFLAFFLFLHVACIGIIFASGDKDSDRVTPEKQRATVAQELGNTQPHHVDLSSPSAIPKTTRKLFPIPGESSFLYDGSVINFGTSGVEYAQNARGFAG